MKTAHIPLTICGLLLCGAMASAQISIVNGGLGGSRYLATTGSAHSIDNTNFKIGTGSITRTAVAANSSFLPTGIALDPATAQPGPVGPNNVPGYTIQFWYKPNASATFQYLFGDSSWVGVSGAFRCFQNGAAGAGNLYIRGPLTQTATTGAPLTTALDPNGWLHLALVVDNKANTLTWYVNGALNASAAAAATGKGANFTCLGYNGSSSAGASGNFDDFCVYNRARTIAEIKADYLVGPMGPQLPQFGGYYQFEKSVNPHLGACGVGTEPVDTFTRLFTLGDTLKWSVSSPSPGPFAGISIITFSMGKKPTVDPRQLAYLKPTPVPGGPYSTPLVPGLEVGSAFSIPPNFTSMMFPTVVAYGGTKVGSISVKIPQLYMVDGDRMDVQYIVADSTIPPLGYGAANRVCFEYVTPKMTGGPGTVHIEARGMSTIQITGFWEIWNTGIIPIKSVEIDLTPVTGQDWLPTGALNSGGTLATGDSYRYNTDTFCDLSPTKPTLIRYVHANKKLTFNFATPPAAPNGGFQGPTNHFVFDCDTTTAQAGNLYAGAIVKVTWIDNKTATGPLVADPVTANQRSQVDLVKAP